MIHNESIVEVYMDRYDTTFVQGNYVCRNL